MPLAQVFWLCAALWTAVLGFQREAGGDRRLATRSLLGLCIGAWLAHVGWTLLYLDRLAAGPELMLPATSGFSVLFVPLGLLLVLPLAREHAVRQRQLAVSLAPLPWALGVARLGCLAAGCCLGAPSDSSLSDMERHPVALYECGALLALGAAVRRLPPARRAPAVLAAFGGVRLVLEPLRAPPLLGEPLVPVELLAALWVAIGVVLALRSRPQARC